MKFDDYEVTISDSIVRCFCPCGGQLRNKGKLAGKCANCQKETPIYVQSVISCMGFYKQTAFTVFNLPEILDEALEDLLIEKINNLSDPIHKMINEKLK